MRGRELAEQAAERAGGGPAGGRPRPVLGPVLRWALGLGLLAALAALVEAAVGWEAVLRPWRALEPRALAAALAAVLASYALRAARVRDALAPRGPFLACLRLTLQHNLLNNLLPMRSGELSFPWLAARLLGIPPARSLPALLWLRLLDVHALGLLALPAAVAALGLPATPALLLALAWLPLPWVVRALAAGGARRLGGRGGRWAAFLRRLEEGLPQGDRALARSLGWTWATWGAKLAAFAWVLGRLAPLPEPPPAAALLLGAAGGDLTSVLPVHGLAGAGTYEAGVVAAMLPFGVPPGPALAGAVNLHLFLLGASLLGGLLSLLLPGARRG